MKFPLFPFTLFHHAPLPPNSISFDHHQLNTISPSSHHLNREEKEALKIATKTNLRPREYSPATAKLYQSETVQQLTKPPVVLGKPCRTTLPPYLSLPFASLGQAKHSQTHSTLLQAPTILFVKIVTGTLVYTVSNTNNEFVLIFDPSDGNKDRLLVGYKWWQ